MAWNLHFLHVGRKKVAPERPSGLSLPVSLRVTSESDQPLIGMLLHRNSLSTEEAVITASSIYQIDQRADAFRCRLFGGKCRFLKSV